MREIRSSGSVEGVVSNRDPYSDSPEPFGWFSTTKAYSGLGADIVMESIAVRRERRWSTAGGKTRPGTGSLRPVAIGAVVEVTKLLKPLV